MLIITIIINGDFNGHKSQCYTDVSGANIFKIHL